MKVPAGHSGLDHKLTTQLPQSLSQGFEVGQVREVGPSDGGGREVKLGGKGYRGVQRERAVIEAGWLNYRIGRTHTRIHTCTNTHRKQMYHVGNDTSVSRWCETDVCLHSIMPLLRAHSEHNVFSASKHLFNFLLSSLLPHPLSICIHLVLSLSLPPPLYPCHTVTVTPSTHPGR